MLMRPLHFPLRIMRSSSGPIHIHLTTHGAGEDANQSGDLDVNYYGYVSIIGDGLFIVDHQWRFCRPGDRSIPGKPDLAGSFHQKWGTVQSGRRGGGIFLTSWNDPVSPVRLGRSQHRRIPRWRDHIPHSGTLQSVSVDIDQNNAQEGAGISTNDTNLTGFYVRINE